MQHLERSQFSTRSWWQYRSSWACCDSRENFFSIKSWKHIGWPRFLKSLFNSYMSFTFAWNFRTCFYISSYYNCLLIIFSWAKVYDLSLQLSLMVRRRRFNVRENFRKTSFCSKNLSQKNNGRAIWCNFLINNSINSILLYRLKVRGSLRY